MNALHQTEGILYRRQRYRETSLLLEWLTRDHGICRMLATGALRPAQTRHGMLDLFYRCELTYHSRSNTDLGRLIEWQPVSTHLGLRHSLVRVQTAQYAAELIAALETAGQSTPGIYELYLKMLAWLETHEPTARLLSRFEQRLAELVGYGGNIEEALHQGHQTFPALRKTLETFFARTPSGPPTEPKHVPQPSE